MKTKPSRCFTCQKPCYGYKCFACAQKHKYGTVKRKVVTTYMTRKTANPSRDCFLCVQRSPHETALAKKVGYICPECGKVYQ